jgi:hypothetical protein
MGKRWRRQWGFSVPYFFFERKKREGERGVDGVRVGVV